MCDVSRARRAIDSTSAALSITGWVLGRHTMVVTPPAAAASLALASVSLCSSPGSRAWTRMSIRPGARQAPRQSNTSMPWAPAAATAPPRARCAPKSAILPSATTTPPVRSVPRSGSMRRAPT
jgi:hypothetical protein